MRWNGGAVLRCAVLDGAQGLISAGRPYQRFSPPSHHPPRDLDRPHTEREGDAQSTRRPRLERRPLSRARAVRVACHVEAIGGGRCAGRTRRQWR